MNTNIWPRKNPGKILDFFRGADGVGIHCPPQDTVAWSWLGIPFCPGTGPPLYP